MSGIRERLIDALKGQGIKLGALYANRWVLLSEEHRAAIVDRVLSTPGMVMVDLNDIDELAKVAARNWPDNYAKSWPWEDMSASDREAYRQRIRDALLKIDRQEITAWISSHRTR